MKRSLLMPAFAAACVVVVCAWRGTTAAPPATQGAHEISPAVSAFMKPVEFASGDDALRHKLKERHNTAVRLLELRADSYRRGIDDSQKVFEAARLVAEAKLDLAQDDEERRATLGPIVEAFRDIETRLEKQFQAALVPAADVERARLARQTAEVQLLRLKPSGSQPTTRP